MFQLPRFYPILDTDALARRGLDPVKAAEQMLEGGAPILQFRHKTFYSRDVIAQMEQVAALCAQAKVPFVVNDRADLAAIFGAVLHLGQEDLAPTTARKVIGPDAIIGFSTHNEAQFRAAANEPADYLALGPIFGTASKLNPDPVVGLEELKRLRPLTQRQVVAIGSITLNNAVSVWNAGADSVAVIGDLLPPVPEHATGPVNNASNFAFIRARTEEWVRLTKTPQNV